MRHGQAEACNQQVNLPIESPTGCPLLGLLLSGSRISKRATGRSERATPQEQILDNKKSTDVW